MNNFTPLSTEEMVFSNTETKDLLLNILQQKVSFPSNGRNTLMLYGTFGSGKTTYSKIFLNEYERSFGGDEAFIESVDVDGNEMIKTTIDRLTNIANIISFNASNKHYFLFDEVDGYSQNQQRRLKSWLNRNDIVCVMTTNYLNKIDKGLLSRCYPIEFNASANSYDYVQRMRQIIQQHKLPMLSDDALFKIAEQSKGDWRDISSMLQQVCSKVSSSPPTNHQLTLVR